MVRRFRAPVALALGGLLVAIAALLALRPVTAQTTPSPTETVEATSVPTTTAVTTATPSGTPMPTTGPEEVSGDRSITVSGTGVISAEASIARIYATVTVTGTTATDVLSETNQRLEDVRKAVTDQGIDPADIESGPVSVFPNPQPGDSAQGYRGVASLTITVRDADKASAVLEAATQAGASYASLSFVVEPDEDQLNQAYQEAFQDAQQRASNLAGVAGGTLGEVIAIAEPGPLPPRPPGGAGGAEAAPGAQALPEGSVPEPGTQTIRVNLVVTFALK